MEHTRDEEISYLTVHRDVKYPRIEFKTGIPVLVLPRDFDATTEFLVKHGKWIAQKQAEIIKARERIKGKTLSTNRNKRQFQALVRRLAKLFCAELDTSVDKVYFRTMKTKWGSCSTSRNLTANNLLRCLPTHLIRYVIFHEVVHTIERKHNDRFWDIISSKYRDHNKYESELFGYWFLVQNSKSF